MDRPYRRRSVPAALDQYRQIHLFHGVVDRSWRIVLFISWPCGHDCSAAAARLVIACADGCYFCRGAVPGVRDDVAIVIFNDADIAAIHVFGC